MSKVDFLLEIGTEEMPAQYVPLAASRYAEILSRYFDDNGLTYANMKSDATPRRLGFLVRELDVRQADRVEEARGPAEKAGKDASGDWTAAAKGFARSQGVNVAELAIRDTPAGTYLFAIKAIKGLPTKDLLARDLPDLIASADWPKSMRWGDVDMKFIRPIRWLLALLGDEVVPFAVAEVASANTTYGHRTLAPQALVIERTDEYEVALERASVLVDVAKRKALIARQVEQVAAQGGYRAQIDADLLDEVTQLVEYPTAFMGEFDENFLAIPARVIITSMKENQRYFPVFDTVGRLAPRFIGVRNGGDVNLAQVVKGNEKVLSARLADAAFFFAEDRKVTPGAWQEKLKTMTYHEELGSVYDRALRVAEIAKRIAAELGVEAAVHNRIATAAAYAKFDLATHMVYEFPELEGYMGGIYATLALGDEAVGQAIAEQYDPKGAGAEIAVSLPGKVLALADKIERLMGGVATQGVPTGSQDPYGLRRAAMGVVRTLAEGGLSLTLDVLVGLAEAVMRADTSVKSTFDVSLRLDILGFLSARFKTWLTDRGLPSDVVEGLVAVRPYAVLEVADIAEGVAELLVAAGFGKLVELSKRVRNIIAKQPEPSEPLQFEAFAEAVEKHLFEAVMAVQYKARAALTNKDATAAMRAMLDLEEPVNAFFDQVMVMDERQDVRARRLALLHSVHHTLSLVLDLSQVTAH